MLFLTYRVVIRLFAVMSAATTVAPESVYVSEEQYWPLTLDAVRDCDLSYMNDKWSEDMIKDGMRSILRVGQLPEIRDKEISVWTYLQNTVHLLTAVSSSVMAMTASSHSSAIIWRSDILAQALVGP